MRRVDRWREHEVLGQLARFAMAGGVSTAIYSLVYYPIATFVPGLIGVTRGAWPMAGNLLGYLAAMLNSVFVWVLTGPLLHGATWWPLVPILFVTPLLTFALNRLWVFA